MIKVKETEPKVSKAKTTITVSDVFINDQGVFCDEEGAIGLRVKELIPEYVDFFTFKFSFEEAEDNGE